MNRKHSLHFHRTDHNRWRSLLRIQLSLTKVNSFIVSDICIHFLFMYMQHLYQLRLWPYCLCQCIHMLQKSHLYGFSLGMSLINCGHNYIFEPNLAIELITRLILCAKRSFWWSPGSKKYFHWIFWIPVSLNQSKVVKTVQMSE